MRAPATFVMAAILLVAPVSARAQTPACSVSQLEGAWVFATGIGQLSAVSPLLSARVRGKQLTAIGTINIDARGNASGTFVQTVADVGAANNTYTAQITVNADCTGTVSLTTGSGATRTDSIVIMIGRDPLVSEYWGMSQVDAIMLTYTARRIAPSPSK